MGRPRQPTWSGSTASEPDANERRRHRRYPVSLITRIAGTRDEGDVGVVTSVGAGGAFVQCENLPSAGSRLKLDFGLGAGLGRVDCRGRVVRINRREGAEVMYGFGVEFDQPPEDLGERLETLHAQRAELVRLDSLGFVDWPVHPGAEPPAPPQDALGLQVWSAAGWVELGGASPSRRGSLPDGTTVATMLRLGLTGLEMLHTGPRLGLAYRGRLLNAPSGAPASDLLAEVRPAATRSAVWIRAMEIQVRLIDLLESLSWRLEHLTAEHREPLVALRPHLAEARRAAAAKRESVGCDDPGDPRVIAVAALERSLATLDSLAGGMLNSLEASSAPDVEWRPRPVAPPPRRRLRLPSVSRLLLAADGSVRGWSPQRKAALLGLLAVIATTVGYAIYAPTTVELVNSREILPLDAELLKRELPVESLFTEGRKVVIQVAPSWSEAPAASRRGAFLAVCSSLGARRYTDAVVVTKAKHEVARWHAGAVEIL